MTQEVETTRLITEYNPVEAALSELRARYAGVMFPVETKEGMKDAKEVRQKLVKLRTGLEAVRKEIKEPALRRTQAIDAEARAITAAIKEIEEPIAAQIAAEEARVEAEKQERERIERERVAAIRVRIDGIRAIPLQSANDKAGEIEITLAELKAIDISEGVYAEFTEEAVKARHQAMGELRQLADSVRAREAAAAALADEQSRLAAERAELERLRAELEAQRASMAAPSVEPAGAETETLVLSGEMVAVDLTSPASLSDMAQAILEQIDGDGSAEADTPAANRAQEIMDEAAIKVFAPVSDADALVSELARFTGMQFIALAKKVDAMGFSDFANELAAVGQVIAKGDYNEAIKSGNWLAMADADKEMALASHACVSLILGDEVMGASVLRAAE